MSLVTRHLMLDWLYPSTPLVIAHRGASASAPENTLPSFELALAQNADAIELDAKRTRDGGVVVMHDATVDRTTDGHGRVSELSWAELKAFDAGAKFDARFAGTRIPRLADVFELVKGKVWINVELTNYTSRGDGLEAAVVELVRKFGLQKKVLLSSFNPFALRRARRLDPRLPAGLLYSHDMPIYLRRAWLAPFVPHEARHPEAAMTDARSVTEHHRRGKRVNVWTVNEREEMLRLFRLGVDAIFTDCPDVALSVRQEFIQR